MAAVRRILVVGPAWVGDMVMAQSLFMALHAQHPEAEIDVLAPAWSVPLLERMPEVHVAITLPLGHRQLGLLTRYRLGRQLRARRYDQAIVIPRSLKAALVPFFAGIARRTGFRGEMRYGLINDMRPLDKQVLTQTVQRQVALGQAPGAALPPPIPQPRLRVDAAARASAMEALQLNADRPVIGLAPGAEYGPAKLWPAAYYAEVARARLARGEAVWLFGSERDWPVAEEIVRAAPGAVNLCGRTSLVEAVDLLSACAAIVSNDSGLMHVAAAVGRPLVAIYGSSTPHYTPPLSDTARVLYRALPCSPCFERECPLGHTDCLRTIDPQQVLAALDALLPPARTPELRA